MIMILELKPIKIYYFSVAIGRTQHVDVTQMTSNEMKNADGTSNIYKSSLSYHAINIRK